MNIVVSSEYEDLRAWLVQMPRLFDDNQGELLYRGRNQVRSFEVDGRKLVVKRFKRNDIVKAMVYTLFRKNKARKSYENAMLLRQRGFTTPHEVAYMERRIAGLVTQVYYVCAYTDSEPIRPRLIEQEPFDKRLAVSYARYVASLHEAGVLHRDLNPTNVLVDTDGHFELIDINRMQFFDGAVPKAECMENLTLFYWLTPAYRFILNEYARQRGWTEADVAEAIRVKEVHDKRWIRRKKITHLGKYEVLH
jgi:serine/threonine protein kinase